MSNVYEADFYAWANEQATLLREGRFGEADIANIAEEIEGLARTEKRELVNRLAVLLTHLFKWHSQPSHRGRSWQLTVREQRARLRNHLEDNPSLKSKLADAMRDAYELALLAAQRETGLGEEAFPAQNPWPIEDVLAEDFLP
ncbi:MAG: DUF29 domain-containing protein [Acetobacteraceae bacterium]|nr:DUF29 domain-containing protein [Acetobacteraceae bacterium]